MTYEAQQQIGKAIRSLPWYMFLVPALLILFVALFDMEAIIADKDPQFGYWAMMWAIAKLGFFAWVLRQLLRYAVFNWTRNLRKAIGAYSQTNTAGSTVPSSDGRVPIRRSSTNVTILSRREIPRHERQPMWR